MYQEAEDSLNPKNFILAIGLQDPRSGKILDNYNHLKFIGQIFESNGKK